MKESLRGKQNASNDEVKTSVWKWLKESYKAEIHALIWRWNITIERNGVDVEM